MVYSIIFQIMIPKLLIFVSAIYSKTPPRSECFKDSKCVSFQPYLDFSDQRVQTALQRIEDTCVLEWFADSSGYYLNRVYAQDGLDATLEITKALQRVWSR